MLRLTGTFIDEITHDIPSQNWSREEWDREFALYSRIGIDTVVIIRSGYKDRCIFPSQSIPNLLPIEDDLGEMFLDLAEKYELNLFWGLYDSGRFWIRQSWWKEVELNKAFIEEVAARYGHRKAFKGWYMCHEAPRNDFHIIEIFNSLAGACKEALDLPVLISPYPMGSKQFGPGDVHTLDETFEHWDRIFSETHGSIDICAFQDGQIQYRELPEFHKGINELCQRFGIECWANIESFDRDMPIKFPPADWRYLKLKFSEASKVASKLITFEFAHFMSPYSSYLSAHSLFKRYCEHFGLSPEIRSTSLDS